MPKATVEISSDALQEFLVSYLMDACPSALMRRVSDAACAAGSLVGERGRTEDAQHLTAFGARMDTLAKRLRVEEDVLWGTYYTVVIPPAPHGWGRTEWHPEPDGEPLTRGRFASENDARDWALTHLGAAPYSIREVK